MQPNFESPESGTRYVLNDSLRQAFAAEGYLRFDGVLPRTVLARLSQRIADELERQQREGRLFSGGGTVSGHLNCFPGAESRVVYDLLQQAGIGEIVRGLSTTALRLPNIGCNLNLPGSAPQNEHVDGYASQPFLVVNVAAVDTSLDNGAMEILRGTHRSDSKYWQILLARPQRMRLPMRQGDVLIRTSTLWHRGMPNRTSKARPMLAFTWEDGGSTREDPYQVHDGRITFLPNRYSTDLKSRIREHAFVALPALGTAYRAVRSLL
ncbi:MAG TPA: phytanoyl-CoA dioxygenase family protein [Polyangiaceae bacterium]|nr:phytanoyl-CoA dioxygenase family protein [Polyangiaceae bacterium]